MQKQKSRKRNKYIETFWKFSTFLDWADDGKLDLGELMSLFATNFTRDEIIAFRERK